MDIVVGLRLIVPGHAGVQGRVMERFCTTGHESVSAVRYIADNGGIEWRTFTDTEIIAANPQPLKEPDHAARADRFEALHSGAQNLADHLRVQLSLALDKIKHLQSSVRASRRSSAPQSSKDRRKSHGRRAKSKSKSKK